MNGPMICHFRINGIEREGFNERNDTKNGVGVRKKVIKNACNGNIRRQARNVRNVIKTWRRNIVDI